MTGLTRRRAVVPLLLILPGLCPVAASALASIAEIGPAKARELGISVRSQRSANDDLRVSVEFRTDRALKGFRWADLELRRDGKRVISAAIAPRTPGPDTVQLDLYMDPATAADATVTIFVYDTPRGGIGYRINLKQLLSQPSAP